MGTKPICPESPCRTMKAGGEGGIRTHGSVNATPDFESGTFDHSATSPDKLTNCGAHSTSNLHFGAECSHAEPDAMYTCRLG
jgi:hypothetical protein